MLGKLARTSALTMLSGAWADVTLMKAGDKPEVVLKDYDFAFISFFKPSDPESVEIDSLLEGAQSVFESKVKNGTWT